MNTLASHYSSCFPRLYFLLFSRGVVWPFHAILQILCKHLQWYIKFLIKAVISSVLEFDPSEYELRSCRWDYLLVPVPLLMMKRSV
jgi:hypothetical protein